MGRNLWHTQIHPANRKSKYNFYKRYTAVRHFEKICEEICDGFA